MKLICMNCGNTEFFQVEVQTILAVKSADSFLQTENACWDEWDQTDDLIRENLSAILETVLSGKSDSLEYDRKVHRFLQQYICCGICGSFEVTAPFLDWSPLPQKLPLEREIILQKDKYLKYMEEKKAYENNMPFLRK